MQPKPTGRIRGRVITGTLALTAAALIPAVSGCPELQRAIDAYQASTRAVLPQVAIVSPLSASTETIGAMGEIEWADIAPEEGTFVTVDALLFDANDALVGTTTLLTGRDAQADGESDIHPIDSANFTPGRYRFRVTLTAPSGRTASATTPAVITFQ